MITNQSGFKRAVNLLCVIRNNFNTVVPGFQWWWWQLWVVMISNGNGNVSEVLMWCALGCAFNRHVAPSKSQSQSILDEWISSSIV